MARSTEAVCPRALRRSSMNRVSTLSVLSPLLAALLGCSGARVETRNPNGDKCVAVDHQATADGTNVQLWTCNPSNAHLWRQASIAAPPPPPPPPPPPTGLCKAAGFAHCISTDFSKEDIFN